MNIKYIIFYSIIALVIIFGIYIITANFSDSTLETNYIKIGVILPLTGPSSDVAQYEKNALELAKDEINTDSKNKYKIDLKYEDSKYDTAEATKAIQKLINIDNIKYIIGEHGSSQTLAIALIAEQNKIILITPASQSSKISTIGDYIFKTSVSTFDETKFFADYIFSNLSLKKIGIITINTDYGKSYISEFSQEFNKLGGEVYFEYYNKEDTDFKTILLKFQDQNISNILLATSRQSAGLIIKQAIEQKYQPKFLAASVAIGPELINIAGKYAEGIIYPYPFIIDNENKTQKIYLTNYKKKYGYDSDMFAANTYDAIMILSNCFEAVGIQVEKVKNCLYSTKNYNGVSGTFSFDENGNVKKDFIIKSIQIE